MRDDAREKAGGLRNLYLKKNVLLDRLLRNEADLHYCLKTEDLEQIEELLAEDQSLMEEIDAIDCGISAGIDGLCTVLGAPVGEIDRLLSGDGDPVSLEVESLRRESAAKVGALARERERLTEDLRIRAGQVKADAENLARIADLMSRKHGPSGKG